MSLNANGLLDMSLDQIIEAKPHRGGRRSGGGAARSSRRGNDSRSRPYGGGVSPAARPALSTAQAYTGEIIVSNLGRNVTEADVNELFSNIGPVKTATLNYNSSGHSKGVANVVFQKPGHAHAAIREYHNRHLDGKPMKIELLVKADAAPILSATPRRVAGTAPAARSAVRGSGAVGGGIRKGGARTGGRPPREKKVAKTQDELDAEMEAYMKDESTMDIDGPAQPAANGVNLNLANALA
ncbi:hypothetical protein BDZ88DRAFT_425424 [Geranomyces variabilis]|nr:hypothetical protein BDZ88DRAFT_425424 [Geranomyces variabilis]KAJ3132905.1 hypothetical protein HDU90_006625 [Geranomyces variabilis]